MEDMRYSALHATTIPISCCDSNALGIPSLDFQLRILFSNPIMKYFFNYSFVFSGPNCQIMNNTAMIK